MHPAIITGTVRSLCTWLWGRCHVPQNVFLVIDTIVIVVIVIVIVVVVVVVVVIVIVVVVNVVVVVVVAVMLSISKLVQTTTEI